MDRISQRHISEFSSEYTDQRKIDLQHNKRPILQSGFGFATLLKMVGRTDPSLRIQQAMDLRADFSDQEIALCGDIMTQSKEKLLENYRKGRLYQMAVTYFLNECQIKSDTDPELFQDLRAYGQGKDIASPEAGERLIMDMPDPLYFRMLRLHMANFVEQDKKMQTEIAPKLRRNFLRLAQPAIERGELPIEPQVLIPRVNESAVHILDLLENDSEEIGGLYLVQFGTVLLAEHLPLEWQEETYGHEMIHALSGRTVSMLQANNNKAIDVSRTGVGFGGPQDRFNWLEEAITQNVIVKLRGKDQTEAYLDYRKVLSLICEQGKIPENFFTEAYFENYQPGSNPVPKWKRLQGALTNAFGPNFLVKLDQLINLMGLEKATQLLQTSPHDISRMRIPVHHPKSKAKTKE